MRRYCGFDERAADDVRSAQGVVEPHHAALVDLFYEELDRHPEAQAVYSGEAQLARLKQTLRGWLTDLFAGPYDDAYFEKRMRIGRRHVQIGLPQRFMFGGIAVIRSGISRILVAGGGAHREASIDAVGRLLDLELAVMLESYAEATIDLEKSAARATTFEEALSLEARIRGVEDDVNRLVASDEALADVCAGLSGATGFEIVLVWRPDPTTGRVDIVASHGIETEAIGGLDVRTDDALIAAVAKSGEPVLLHGVKDQPRVPHPILRERSIDTVLALPIRSGTEVMGVLALLSSDRLDLGEIQRGILQAVADHLGTAWKTRILLGRQAESERVETVARFSRVLAHEVRNPLNSMSLQAALMRRRMSGIPEEARKPLESALLAFEQETRRLNELVEHYLLIGRSGQLRREVVAVAETVRAVLRVHESALAEAKIGVELDLDADVRVEIDVPKITQVLHNLVRNAIDAMAGAGRLVIRAHGDGDTVRISVAAT